jgi:hypothetical protein
MSEIRSKVQTKEFDEGYDRTFGPNRKPVRGRWVYDERQQKLVSADEYVPPNNALDAPIMAGRFYEGTVGPAGEDLGSRAKHREFMRAKGLTTMDDFKETTPRAAAEKEPDHWRNRKERGAVLDRAYYDVFQSPGTQKRPERKSYEGEKLPDGWH